MSTTDTTADGPAYTPEAYAAVEKAARARAATPSGQTPEPPIVLVIDEAAAVFAAASHDATTRALADLARTVAPRSLQRHPYGG